MLVTSVGNRIIHPSSSGQGLIYLTRVFCGRMIAKAFPAVMGHADSARVL
jgi:hypothetical protein